MTRALEKNRKFRNRPKYIQKLDQENMESK